jgi:hypothetical protein
MQTYKVEIAVDLAHARHESLFLEPSKRTVEIETSTLLKFPSRSNLTPSRCLGITFSFTFSHCFSPSIKLTE